MSNEILLLDKLYITDFPDEIKHELSLWNDDDELVKIYEKINLKNGQEYYKIPRYFLKSENVKDLQTIGKDININLNKKFKPRDIEQKKVINTFLEKDHGIIGARVGFGKTYVAIDAIARLKKKALIIVHNETLFTQWKERIIEYTDLTEDDIGTIKANKRDFDKPICLSTVQTLSSRYKRKDKEFEKNMYNANFGITIFDEAHITSAAPDFSNSFNFIFSKKLFGMSATPYRTDSFNKLLEWHIGEIIYDNTEFISDINVILFDIPINLGGYANYINMGQAKSFTNRYATFLSKQEIYLYTLSKLNDICFKYGKKVLNLSSRINILESVFNGLVCKDHASVIHGKCKNGFDKDILLCTNGVAKAGLDVDGLNVLIFATPLTSELSLVQSIGRVADRKNSGNKQTFIIDINNSEYERTNNMRKHRISVYNKHNFNIINADNLFDFENIIKEE